MGLYVSLDKPLQGAGEMAGLYITSMHLLLQAPDMQDSFLLHGV